MQLLGFNIAHTYPALSLEGKMIINTLNPHSYCMARKDRAFETALQDSDQLVPDGIGIVWAARTLNKQKISKIAGYDIFIHIMAYLNEISGSCFFLGASKDTLALIKARARQEYPNIQVYTYSPPYKPEFDWEESHAMCAKIRASGAHVLFVGMTAPKQEKWVYQNKAELSPAIICSIGAVFDFYAGTVKRSHPFWIKLGLEWLPRFLKEPKRLAERNLVSTPKFILEVFSYKLFKKGLL
ncbi:WecB/TagA/CpsF family glycosyltransferase [Ulvibacterium marinum]|uniref:Glycosyltransferase n=1 Tax=Ulvibacterium marinum TaxID=2419782 RepID=A0A3B0C594_9FLAO|nr:WecB/TagA/CpsF family glycosyltransferase [Ulvibacterium marinum]RKN79768.1 glycosyltransferase [Ulvibacterium marinum]